MTDETTTEQLAEIEGQGDTVQVREGRWRTRGGGIRNVKPTPSHDSRKERWPWRDAEFDQTWSEGGLYNIIGESSLDLVKYLGPIEPDKTQELPEYTPPEGWRVLAVGEVLRDGDVTVRADGYQYPTERVGSVVGANQRYIRPIEPQSQPQPESDTELQAQVAFLKGREVTLGTRLQQEREVTTRLRGDLELVQNQLGESRQRVTQLEELVGSLRTINETQEKAFTAAGKENTALRNQLTAVKAELASVAADRYRLQVELDAAQQVPADSPELRQLWANLAEVAHDRDTYRHAHELLLQDIDATHQRTKAETVETIAEWLVPVQAAIAAADNVAESTRVGWLAKEVIQHLPTIMRNLTRLVDEEPDPQLAPY